MPRRPDSRPVFPFVHYLGTSQYAVLRCLGETGGLRTASIARATGISYASLMTTLPSLVRRGLISRLGRGYQLTSRGRRVVEDFASCSTIRTSSDVKINLGKWRGRRFEVSAS